MIAKTVVENIATVLGEDHKIKVVFKGNECCTDGKTIFLPSLPETLPGKLVEKIRGFLDHEVAHILFTDFSFIDKARKWEKTNKQPLKFVLNAVEDIRIENKMASVYKGCALNFEVTRNEQIQKFREKWDALGKGADLDAESDPVFRILIFFIFIAQIGWDDPFVTTYAADIMPILEHLAPEIEKSKKP